MEANKEEAVRARELAEKKLLMGDYFGARKMALKAQKLYQNIDNVSQLIVVCDVHCSAANKLNGSDSDWYAILQIDRFSEEAVILKQYKKLAFSLHPDKNKYAGAEAAFKLIGEAKRELTDPTRRALFDAKCRGLVKPAPPKVAANHTNKKGFATKPPGAFHQNIRGEARQQAQPEHTRSDSYKQPQGQTFWTSCQSCRVKFQYYAQFRNKMLKCQNCNQHFVARELPPVAIPHGSSNFGFASHQGVNVQAPGNAAPQSNGFKSTFAGVDLRTNGGKATGVRGKPKMKEAEAGNTSGFYSASKPQEKADEQVAMETDKKSAVHKCAPENPSRSSSKKRPSSYSESVGGDDFVAPSSKRSKEKKSSADSGKEMKKPGGGGGILNREHSSGSASTVADENMEEPKPMAGCHLEESRCTKKSRTEGIEASEDEASISEKLEAKGLDSGHESELGQENIFCPNSEFTEFQKDKSRFGFDVNQIWALYDQKDSMPRFYALVKKVLSPDFKLRITWLEACPGNEEEEDWEDADFPIACGKFSMGGTEEVEDHLMFSHQVDCRKGKSRGTFVIYPKKGETWALFKGWDMKWASEPDKHKPPYCYDFVEIVSDFNKDVGIEVACLGKVQGFISIFQRASHDEDISFCIKPSELFRFSHRIPSYRMTGKEGEGVPAGSFEFDTAALPSSLYSSDDINNTQAETKVHCSKEATGSQSDSAKYKKDPTTASEKTCTSRASEMNPERRGLVIGLAARLPNDVRSQDNQGYVGHFGVNVADTTQPQRPSVSKGKYEDVAPGESVSTPTRSAKGLQKGNGDADVNEDVSRGEHLSTPRRSAMGRGKGNGGADVNEVGHGSTPKRSAKGLRKENDDADVDKVVGPGEHVSTPRRSARDLRKENDDADVNEVVGPEEHVLTPRRSARGLRKENGDADVNQPVVAEGADKPGEHVSTPRRSARRLRKGNGETDVNPPVIVQGADKRKNPSTAGNHAQASGSKGDSDNKRESLSSVGNSASLAGTPVSPAKLKVEAARHDFRKGRLEGNFQIDQVWAIFSSEDRMPKNYVRVKKIESPPFKLQAAILETPFSRSGTNVSPSCGAFKEGKTVEIPLSEFSHLVHAECVGKTSFSIYPGKGEIWAVYKKPESGQREGDGECDIVEVLERNARSIKAVTLTPLAKLGRFESFYRAPKSKRLQTGVMEIPLSDHKRFSHQCAAYYHKGVMNGCWEIDASSVPGQVIHLE